MFGFRIEPLESLHVRCLNMIIITIYIYIYIYIYIIYKRNKESSDDFHTYSHHSDNSGKSLAILVFTF